MSKNLSFALSLAGIVLGMLGLAFAAVPLYRAFCQVTGLGGTTAVAAASPTGAVSDRVVTVRFNADVHPSLPWRFSADQPEVRVRIGERALAFFTARNHGDKAVTGVANYNVTPLKSGSYFNKTECFCFQEQRLAPGEDMRFPVSFFLDPALLNDSHMNDVHTVTLSYTFFRHKEKGVEPKTQSP